MGASVLWIAVVCAVTHMDLVCNAMHGQRPAGWLRAGGRGDVQCGWHRRERAVGESIYSRAPLWSRGFEPCTSLKLMEFTSSAVVCGCIHRPPSNDAGCKRAGQSLSHSRLWERSFAMSLLELSGCTVDNK